MGADESIPSHPSVIYGVSGGSTQASEGTNDHRGSREWNGNTNGFTLSRQALEDIEAAKMAEIQRMDHQVRDKLRSTLGGAQQYNMKVLLRGERGTGKSLLWRRFQGQPYSVSYTPTAQIQSGSIQWNSHSSGCDRVRVEVWDVVDHALSNSGTPSRNNSSNTVAASTTAALAGISMGKGGTTTPIYGNSPARMRTASSDVAMGNNSMHGANSGPPRSISADAAPSTSTTATATATATTVAMLAAHEAAANAAANAAASNPVEGPAGELVTTGAHALQLLDASVVDVYKNASAVIFLVNPASLSSLQYVRDKYKEVPLNVSILLIMTFKDKVAEAEIRAQKQKQAMNSVDGRSAVGQYDDVMRLPDFAPLVKFAQIQALAQEISAYRREQKGEHAAAGRGQQQREETNDQEQEEVPALEVSLQNGYGLLQLDQFLDLPFLKVKQKSLEDQLARAKRDYVYFSDNFHEMLSVRRHSSSHTSSTGTGIGEPGHRSDYEEYLHRYQSRHRTTSNAPSTGPRDPIGKDISNSSGSSGGAGNNGRGPTTTTAARPPPFPVTSTTLTGSGTSNTSTSSNRNGGSSNYNNDNATTGTRSESSVVQDAEAELHNFRPETATTTGTGAGAGVAATELEAFLQEDSPSSDGGGAGDSGGNGADEVAVAAATSSTVPVHPGRPLYAVSASIVYPQDDLSPIKSPQE